MAKATYYFSHDYNPRSDDKIKKLLVRHGMLGYGIFWALVEGLYSNANSMQLDCHCIAYDLHCSADVVQSVITDFDLFVIKDGFFGSMSIQARMDDVKAKSMAYQKNALKRWDKPKNDAKPMQLHEETDAIALPKESKVNKIKEKERKVKKGRDAPAETLVLQFPFESENFKKNWQLWKDYKKVQHNFVYKSIITEQQALIELTKLTENEQVAIEIILQSIGNGYKGFFPLKNNNTNGTGKQGFANDKQAKFADQRRELEREIAGFTNQG